MSLLQHPISTKTRRQAAARALTDLRTPPDFLSFFSSMTPDPFLHQSANLAQDSYYQAMVDADLDALMSVWVNDDAVLCILPSGERLSGLEAIRETHEEVFSQGGVHVTWHELQSFETATVSVHHVIEQFDFNPPDEAPQRFLAYATNVFLRTSLGWQLMLHHASQAGDDIELSTPAPAQLH
ncbi:MAG: nuclear transport factor 2 family protein [Lautropia sp.]|nr:nuclear transport factor 2 family protein [Lautropia sp.]